MSFRKFLFWCHLILGCVAGAVILMMSVTGVLLTYEKQMTAWADRGYRVTPPSPDADRLPVQILLEKGREAKGALPATVTMRAERSEPAALGFGREGTLYVNPYTGSVLGEGSQRIRAFFQSVTAWHRWFGREGPSRIPARALTGACNFAFLLLVTSGVYLWFPRKWRWQNIRAITWFRAGLSGKARNFNWHNVAGFWCCIPLFVIVASGVVMSYPWANSLVYQMAGSAVPQQGGAGRAGGHPDANVQFDGLDAAWTRAEQRVAGWQSISLRVPTSDRAPLVFTIDQSNGGQPQERGTLSMDRSTGEIRQWEPFSALDAGRRARTWMRFAHTGEYYGVVGQTVAGVASAGGALLVWTGIMLALARLRRSRARKKVIVEQEEPTLV